MDPITIALICAASFGTVIALSAFLRQLVLSRDKTLNDEAQQRAFVQEALELEKIRQQMLETTRFNANYAMLGANKDAISYLDNKVEELFAKKAKLIERYAQITITESAAIMDGNASQARKLICDRLKAEIDEQMTFYTKELENIQQRRASLWDTNKELKDYLLSQEKSRNENLDAIYKQHSSLLEKVFVRHIDNSEHVMKSTIEAGTSIFKSMLLAPLQLLLQYFNISSGVSLEQSKLEKAARQEVDDLEKDTNSDDAEFKNKKGLDKHNNTDLRSGPKLSIA